MPPKLQLRKSTGKSKSLSNAERHEPPESQLSPEAAQHFELELCWCIQQLQTALKSGKLSPKQVQDHTKALNTLMSNSTSLVRKRQVMRLSFGDYRSKMAIEDKKSNTVSSKIKISPASPSKKSVFFRKAAFTASDNSFRFNFPTSTGDIVEGMSNVTIENDSRSDDLATNANIFHFEPSNNGFRFNFATDT